MAEFWETSFVENQAMWGYEPSDSAILTKNFFVERGIQDILLPGIGYGRNAKIFLDSGIHVTGIEISQTAIGMARENGLSIPIFHGSVGEMPFDDRQYDGVFCYALLHLLDKREREKFIQDCYNQLKPSGYMVFTAISKKAPMYGSGKKIDHDYYEIMDGLRMFFYDHESARHEFGQYGLVELSEIWEPHKNKETQQPFPFVVIKCRKPA